MCGGVQDWAAAALGIVEIEEPAQGVGAVTCRADVRRRKRPNHQSHPLRFLGRQSAILAQHFGHAGMGPMAVRRVAGAAGEGPVRGDAAVAVEEGKESLRGLVDMTMWSVPTGAEEPPVGSPIIATAGPMPAGKKHHRRSRE